ncbi:MAG: ABC transporter permease [Anaerolineales bacterium]
MRNIWLVIKHEITTTLRQRSFWIVTFLMPALLLAINTYAMIQDSDLGDTGNSEEEAENETGPDLLPIGLVDEGGLIAGMPPSFPPDLFIPFPDEASARAALEADEIEQYVIIPADYVSTGEITVYDKDFRILASGEQMGVAFGSAGEAILGYLINYNLTGDAQLITTLQNPTPGHLTGQHIVNPPVEKDANDRGMAILVASVLPYIYYFLLLIGSSYLMRSVVAEKENRTAEVLLLSLRPRELMVGKILGLGVVTLIQLVAWVGGGMLVLNRGADFLNVSDFTFPPGFFPLALLFLILGYLLYGSVMAAAGAVAPNAREGGQVTWLLIIPLMPTLMFGREFLELPNGTMSLVLSLFPFSAPSAMVTRMAVASVPAWQVIVSLGGVAVTAYAFVVLAARFFRSGNLLSQASFNWRRLVTGWRE